jgi:hypothetical protein
MELTNIAGILMPWAYGLNFPQAGLKTSMLVYGLEGCAYMNVVDKRPYRWTVPEKLPSVTLRFASSGCGRQHC